MTDRPGPLDGPRACTDCQVAWRGGTTCWACGKRVGGYTVPTLTHVTGPNQGAIGVPLIL